MTHLRILLRARTRGFRNRLAGHPPRWWAGRLTAGVVLAAALIALGQAAAPGLLAPPDDIVTAIGLDTTGGKLPAGAAALEAAFWLASLASAILNFRVMELLFRRKDIRAVEPYPVASYALYVDRLLAALAEALGAIVVVIPFFMPLIWHGGSLAAAVSIALVAVGLLASSAVGFAIEVAAGAAMVTAPSTSQSADPSRPSATDTRDIYGGSGQVFLYSPGIALAVSVLIILMAKLAVGEVLGAGEMTRAFGVGMGVLAIAFVVAVGASFRQFVRSFPRMTARFNEVDFVGYNVSAKHQHSAFSRPGLGEQLLPIAARSVFRTYSLQFGRRHMLARWSYGLGWLAAGVGLFRLSQPALPGWLVATLPAVVLSTLANPWNRLSAPEIRPNYQNFLGLPSGADLQATTLFALRESLLVTVPYAVLVVIAGGIRYGQWANAAGLATLAVAGCTALNGVVAAAWWRFGRSKMVEVLAPVLAAIGLVAIANVSLGAMALAAVVLIAGHIGPALRWTAPTTLR